MAKENLNEIEDLSNSIGISAEILENEYETDTDIGIIQIDPLDNLLLDQDSIVVGVSNPNSKFTNPNLGELPIPSSESPEVADLGIVEQYLFSTGFEGIGNLLQTLDTPAYFEDQLTDGTVNPGEESNSTLTSVTPSNGILPGSVFGSDDRIKIDNTTAYPWSTVGRIEVEFPDGTRAFGSGAMITPYHFLTAGHVIHDSSSGGWATDIDISLGQNGSEKFYGEADWTYARTYTGWTNNQNPDHDWAVITLDRNIGNYTGWLGYEWRGNDADYNGMIVNTAGYPGDLSFNGQDMYFASGPVAFADTNQLYYNGTMDTFGGQSGSPVYRYNSSTNQRYINAIHAYGNGGNGYNEGTRITETKFNSLQSWKSDDDNARQPIDRPDLVDYDDWFGTNFAYFSLDPVSPGDSFTARSVVRNNGTTTAGNFNVSFYASTNDFISTSDYYLGDANISSLDPFSWADAIWTGSFPSIPEGDYYLGWLIDSADSQNEFLEGNNTGIITSSLLTVTTVDDNYEENDTLATAYNLSNNEQTWLSSIAGLGIQADDDWYEIEITPGYENLIVDLQFTHADGDIDLYVSDTNGNFVSSSTSITDNESINTILPTSGTYYLKIDYGNAGNTYDLWWDDVVVNSSTGSISGTKWNDLDGDGVQDSGEAGLQGWTIYLDQNQNSQLDSGETSTTTDANGNYSFTNLAADTYYVAEVLQSGWEQTYPRNSSGSSIDDPGQIVITTTNSQVPMVTYGEVVTPSDDNGITPQTNVSGSLINIDDFRADSRFAGIDGSGFATVILDTGIDLNHPFFGSDSNNDGVADRIVYHYDFADGDADGSDVDGHGSNVSSIVASSDNTYTGMAPGADIIHLKVFEDNGGGNFGYTEQALQWVIANAATYNIASVNMSLGDSGNYTTAQTLYGIDDELAALEAMDIVVASASGNSFYGFNSQQGVAYPSADPNSLSIGAVFDSNMGNNILWSSGATAYTSGADRLTPFSQRDDSLTTLFAPGAPITGAGPNGGTVTQTGTSQASPHIAGIAVLAQQLAQQTLGRRLTVTEFNNLLVSTGVTINDGDDENDNVSNTGLDFKRVDVQALGEAILNMATSSDIHVVNLSPGETVTDKDFGNRLIVDNFIGETGTISNLTHTATTINLDRNYTNPVVFAQPLSFNGSQPATVRLSNITNNSFTIQAQEPNHLDGAHAGESLSYMVLEAGTWELANGTLLEVGTTQSSQQVAQGWETVSFDANFDNNPVVMSQVQTFNGSDFVRTRQDDITSNGFLVGMEEEEANKNTGHVNEKIGYMAMSGGSGSWNGLNYTAGYTGDNVTDAWKTQSFGAGFTDTPQILASLASYDGTDPAGLRYRNLNNNQVQIKVEEDTSADTEMAHTSENVSFLAIEGTGLLTGSPVVPPSGTAMGETGTISNLTHTAKTINLSRNYVNPVVFAQPLSYNGSAPAAVRLDNITNNSFTVSVQEPNNEDGTHAAENLSFMVLEAGNWELADGTLLQVGTTQSSQLVSQGWETVNFNAGFSNNPVVMSQIQTFNGSDFVRTRQDNIGANGFQVGMEEEEANKNSGHVNETIGYMAMSGGTGNWSGLNYTAGYTGDNVTDAWKTQSFGAGFTQTPQILASLASYDGADPAGIRRRNLNNNQVQFKVEEDTSFDGEMAHTTENVSFLAIEGSGILEAVNVGGIAASGEDSPVLAGVQTLNATSAADTFVLGDATEAYYDNMGIQDYALILNFESSEDVIQLHGNASDYQLGAAPSEVPQGTGIFLNNNELVGVVSGVSDLALDADYFSFV